MLPDGRYCKVIDFACHDGTEYPFWWEDKWRKLSALYDAIAAAYGEHLCVSPVGLLTVVSGYRTPQWNAGLIKKDAKKGAHGVASSSQHTQGNAGDLRPIKGTLDDLHILILNEHESGGLPMLGGLGIYPESNWVHVDTYVPPDNHLRLWTGV